MSDKTYKCPFCDYKYINKLSLYNHMEAKHKNQLNNMSPARVYFNIRNKKDHGNCIICKKETPFNENTERYERLCSDECRKKYRQIFRTRMKGAGKDPDTYLQSAEVQNKMLAGRKISGSYKWNDGTKTPYVGSYEMDFLLFCENILGLTSKDIMGPAPQVFEYTYQGKKHFHIPDFYIPSMNLIIQIKSATNKHYRERDLEKELLCDKLVKESPYNYFKIYDKKYDDFEEYFRNFDFNEKK